MQNFKLYVLKISKAKNGTEKSGRYNINSFIIIQNNKKHLWLADF